jgi:hypothetical protein
VLASLSFVETLVDGLPYELVAACECREWSQDVGASWPYIMIVIDGANKTAEFVKSFVEDAPSQYLEFPCSMV